MLANKHTVYYNGSSVIHAAANTLFFFKAEPLENDGIFQNLVIREDASKQENKIRRYIIFQPFCSAMKLICPCAPAQ